MAENDSVLPINELAGTDPTKTSGQSAGPDPREKRGLAENVSDATIPLKIAEAKIAIYDRAEVESDKTVKPANYDALAAVYALLLYILQGIGLKAFYQANAIQVHGNVKNACQPLVAFLFRHYDHRSYARQTIWRWSCALSVACANGISEHAMPDFIAAHGLDRLVEDYRKIRLGKAPTQALTDEELANSISWNKDDSTALPNLECTNAVTGKVLAVIDCNAERNETHIVAILRPAEKQIMRIMAADARRRLAAGT
ncbi:hypothetical protein WHZ78_09520 [Bradyrhizobium symbiodeficiens]|uniref:hypothetical protein n=1 Tax=Bradyrhizobium symbiodeficiens TaxID=1404367 RepID=UPI0030CE4566